MLPAAERLQPPKFDRLSLDIVVLDHYDDLDAIDQALLPSSCTPELKARWGLLAPPGCLRRSASPTWRLMGHLMDRCDVIDVLEESVTLKRPVTVELKGGGQFVDQPRDVVTADDGEWVKFRDHDQMLVDDIAFCAPAQPPAASYSGKT